MTRETILGHISRFEGFMATHNFQPNEGAMIAVGELKELCAIAKAFLL